MRKEALIMPLYSFEGHMPRVHPDAWVAPTATLVGRVTVHAGASIWFNAVLRADFGEIVIGAGANIQDGSILHGGEAGTWIGEDVTVGHACIVHGATIGTRALIGSCAVVLDGATVGIESLVAANSTVTPGTSVPEGTLALGSPAKLQGSLSDSGRSMVVNNSGAYHALRERYRAAFDTVEQ